MVRYRFRSRRVVIVSGRVERAVTPHRAHVQAVLRLRRVLTDAGLPFASVEVLSVERLG